MKGDALGSFEQLMAELKRLCAEGRTGTLFIATSENHAGQLGLRNGVVVAARFRLKTGLDAARGLAQVRSARFTFMRDLVEPADPRHPLSSTAVLTILTGAGPAGGQADNLVVHNILTAALVEYLGPMAAIVVRDQLRDAARAGREPADAVEPLARLIDDPAGAAAFRAQATAALAARNRLASQRAS
jgi:hypothetical protein